MVSGHFNWVDVIVGYGRANAHLRQAALTRSNCLAFGDGEQAGADIDAAAHAVGEDRQADTVMRHAGS